MFALLQILKLEKVGEKVILINHVLIKKMSVKLAYYKFSSKKKQKKSYFYKLHSYKKKCMILITFILIKKLCKVHWGS